MGSSPEFDALLAATTAERAHADAITSFVAQTNALVKWQHRAEVAEAALARVEEVCAAFFSPQAALAPRVVIHNVRAAMKEPK